MSSFGTQCIERLETYYNNLDDTNIKFLFFLADDLQRPKMKCVFKKWNVGGYTFYLTEGLQNGRNGWYVHIYEESLLKYFVRISTPSTYGIHNVTIQEQSASGDVNHGDHITFGVVRQRVTSNALLLTHLTRYIDCDCAQIAPYTFLLLITTMPLRS